MKKTLNPDLVRFHVTEAERELASLLLEIRRAQGEKPAEGGAAFRGPSEFREGRLAASLGHAYHHLNFAWNGRNKTMAEADSQFSRNEKFPRHFVRYWPRTALNGRQKA